MRSFFKRDAEKARRSEPRKRKARRKAKPQQYVQGMMNTPMLDYQVYVFSRWEKLAYFLLAFATGAAAGFIFYGNLFMENGLPTQATHISNLVVCGICGAIAGTLFLPMRQEGLRRKRQRELRNQFRDLLSTLSVSFTTGKNVHDAFAAAYEDLDMQYPEGAYILTELRGLLDGMNNNVPIDEMLEDLARRSGNPDIRNFSNVFRICYYRGGSLKDVVRRTNEVIGEKISCADEIETKLASNRNQLNVMSVMPIGVVALFRFSNEGLAQNFAQPIGIVAMTVGVVIFVCAFLLGQRTIRVER